MTKMIPPVPTAAASVMMPTPKQKIGFSIESIVGNDAAAAVHDSDTQNSANNSNGPSSPPQTPPAVGSTHLPTTPLLTPPQMPTHMSHSPLGPHHLSVAQQHALHQHLLMQQQQHQLSPKSSHELPLRHDIQDIIQRLHHNAAAANISAAAAAAAAAAASNNAGEQTKFNAASPTSLQTRLSPNPHHQLNADVNANSTNLHLKRERSPAPAALEQAQNPAQRHQPPHTPPKSVSPQSSQPPSPPNLSFSGSPASASVLYPKPANAPMLVPGMPPAGLVRPFPMGPGGPPPPPPTAVQPGVPDIKALPPYINAPPELPPQHNPHLIAAAQFQMAAALQAGHVLGPAGPFMPNPGMPRESYPLYPWLLSRHGRIFPHRFPGSK